MFRDPSNVPGEGIVVGYDQMPAAAPLEAIGKIQTASGSVTALRADGVLVRPSVGALVYQGDTIETGADGAVSITFIDGTAFNLSATTRLVLNEFSCERTGAPNSALFSLVQGAFSFVAGKLARTGGLNIDTPFATIRGTAQDRGIGILTLAALTFAAIKESEAASRHDAFLDDGTITYKDLAHGTFEIVTRDGRVIIADDPGETIVVDPTGSVARIPNSASRMAELQQFQQNALATLSLGEQQGAAPGGSSTQQFDIPVQLQPINFGQPSNGPAPEAATTTHVTAVSSGFIEVPQLKPPDVIPVLAPDAGLHTVIEATNTTGSTHADTVSAGTLTFTNFKVSTVSATMVSMTWSGGATPPSGLAEVLAGALSITTEGADTGFGSIATTFSAADRNFDFLAANETLTIVYNVTVTDNNGVSLTQPVTIITTGTNDAPVLAADASGLRTIAERPNTTGTLTFTDVDLNDHHTVSTSVASTTGSGGATLPSGLAAVLAGAISTTTTDSTGSRSGLIAVTFSAADDNFDFLPAGQTLAITYNVTVTDNNGVSSSQPFTITITGANDAPVLDARSGSLSYTEHQAATAIDTALTVSDVNSANLVSATVQITGNFVAGQDVLGFTNQNGIAGSYNAATGVLTLTGQASVAQYQAALQSVTYFNSSDNPSGQTRTISYQVDDGSAQNSLSNVVTATVSVTPVNDAPVITSGVATVAVSEEGLPNGVADTLPAPLDTTNSTTASGTITASDADGDALTMSLGTPSASLTSGGVAIAWMLQDAHTLIGKAGATTIITATITNAGAYNVTLSGPIDHPVAGQEDDTTFTVPVSVSDGHATTHTTLSVIIEDDSPKAAPVEVSVVATDSKTNVMLILDVSGSMGSPSGLPGLTRLDAAKAAVNELLDQYDSRGDVMVRIVTFSTAGTAVGSAWKSVADAKVAIANLSAGGNTNYDAALLTAMTAFTAGTKLSGPGTQNVSYFLSDGEPTTGNDWPQITGTQSIPGIQDNERGVWESFLTTNNIVSFALGISNGAPQTANLNPITFDPASGTQLADTPIIVTDLGQLANALVFTVPPVTGSVLIGVGGATSNSFGADGGFVKSMTVDGVTYTFNPAANGGAGGITTIGGGSFTYNETTKTLTVDTDTSVVGGELAMMMTTGAFTFQPPIDFSSESVGYVLVDGDGDTQSSTLHFSAAVLPAGVAGSPINLGLTDPTDYAGPVTVTIAGIPSGWTLSEGAANGDGSWTIQASSVSMLSITSPANYAGAIALQVTMRWTNADGSSGFARATDNVEVFAQGAPIFAWSGEDHLTGSSDKDLFVFAQPIGHDTIYSFNTSEDQIDLIGYWGFTNFNDVQDHLSEDSASNAVITLANGQSITLFDVPVSSLSANNFVFDHTPALLNTGTLTINDGAMLPLSGIITNTGTIALDSTGNEAHLELIQNGITLQGGGQVVLSDSDENLISGTAPSVTLTNMDNTISGTGQLGAGQMTLINNGTITAIGTHALVVDTGTNVVTNAGTLEATGSGSLILNSDIVNSGLIWANGGNITINGAVTGSGNAMISGAATLELGAESSANVTFGADAAGTLILRDPTGFTGTISGLSSTDHIDLANISYEIASLYSITYSLSANITTLVITDGTNTDTINLLGNYTIDTAWHFSDDGHGGTIVSDAPVSPISELTSVQSTSADNNLLRSPFADAASDIHIAAAEHSSPNSTARAALAHSDDSTVPAAGDINDQFHFAYANPGTLDSPQLLGQAASHAAAEIALVTANSVISLPHNFNSPAFPTPPDNFAPQAAKNPSLFSGTGSRDDLFQILDDILTDAAQAPLDTVTAPDQNHVAWMNAHHDKPSSDFIIHA